MKKDDGMKKDGMKKDDHEEVGAVTVVVLAGSPRSEAGLH